MLASSIMIFENLIKSASDNQRTDCQNYTKLRTFIVNVLERKVKSIYGWSEDIKHFVGFHTFRTFALFRIVKWTGFAKGVRESLRHDSDYLLRLAGKAMVIYAKHLAKRCHREGEFLQPNNFSLLLSIYLDRLTLKLLCILFLSSFFTFTIKEETMTNFFRTTM